MDYMTILSALKNNSLSSLNLSNLVESEETNISNSIILTNKHNSNVRSLVSLFNNARNADTYFKEPIQKKTLGIIQKPLPMSHYESILNKVLNNKSLLSLKLSGITLSEPTWRIVVSILENHPNLKTLDLSHTGLNDNHLRLIWPAILKAKSLQSIILDIGNKLSPTLVKRVYASLPNEHPLVNEKAYGIGLKSFNNQINKNVNSISIYQNQLDTFINKANLQKIEEFLAQLDMRVWQLPSVYQDEGQRLIAQLVQIFGNQAIHCAELIGWGHEDYQCCFDRAMQEANISLITFAEACGIDINQKDTMGNSVLHRAIIQKDKLQTSILLSLSTININQTNLVGESALILATKNSLIEIAILLSKHSSIHVGLADIEGNTALHYAVQLGFIELAILLIQNGANIQQSNHAQQTPLSIAKSINQELAVILKRSHFEYKIKPFIEPLQLQLNRYEQSFEALGKHFILFKDKMKDSNSKKYKSLLTLNGHKSEVYILKLLPNNLIVSGSDDNSIRIWNPRSGLCQNILYGHTSYVRALAVIHNGYLVSGSLDKSIKVWNISSGECINTFYGHTGSVHSLIDIDDTYIASGSSDNTIKIWDINTGKCIQTFKGHTGTIRTLVKLNVKTIISGSFDSTLKIWNINTGECQKTIQTNMHPISALIKLFDGRIISGSNDCTLKIWDTHSDICQITLYGHNNTITSLVQLPDGRVISSSYDNTFKIWNILNGHCLETYLGSHYSINALAVISENKLISSSGNNIEIWESNMCEASLEKSLHLINGAPSRQHINEHHIVSL